MVAQIRVLESPIIRTKYVDENGLHVRSPFITSVYSSFRAILGLLATCPIRGSLCQKRRDGSIDQLARKLVDHPLPISCGMVPAH